MSKSKEEKTAIIIGASSGVGRALAERLSSEGFDLGLVARSARDLSALRSHLHLVNHCQIFTNVCDLRTLTTSDVASLIDQFLVSLNSISHVYLIAGANSIKDELPMEFGVIDEMFAINANSQMALLNILSRRHRELSLKSIALCSTIAAPVPRKRNLAYACAKGALESFAKGLRHYLSPFNIPVQIYRLGYVDTNLSFGQKLLFPVISPEKAAIKMISNRYKDFGIRYLPGFWFFVILILKCLPWKIYRRLSF